MAACKELSDSSEERDIHYVDSNEMYDSSIMVDTKSKKDTDVIEKNWSLPELGDRDRDAPILKATVISESLRNNNVKPYRNEKDPNSKCKCETNVNRLPTESIKATVDTTSYNKYVASKLVEYMDSVGALMLDNEYIGTVFRVGSVYVMTAAHVVDQLKDVLRKQRVCVIFDDKACERSEEISGWSVKDMIFEDKHLDVCVLELHEVPNRKKMPEPLMLSKDTVQKCNASHITLIGYGNPFSSEKLMEHCRIADNKDKQKAKISIFKYDVKNDDKLDSCGYCEFEHPDKIIVCSRMMEGGSGSPGLVTVGNPTGNLKTVVMLLKGIPRYFYDMPETEQANFKYDFDLFTVCLAMSSLYESMTESHPKLASEIFYIPGSS